MNYGEYIITDNRFGLVSGDVSPLGEIWGLSNMKGVDPDTGEDYDERFIHLGYTGYPDGAAWIVERRDESGQPVQVLAAFDGTAPAGGTAVAEEDVPALLVSDYGWPEGVVLQGAALPVVPEAE